jgi:hypothetical protein
VADLGLRHLTKSTNNEFIENSLQHYLKYGMIYAKIRNPYQEWWRDGPCETRQPDDQSRCQFPTDEDEKEIFQPRYAGFFI